MYSIWVNVECNILDSSFERQYTTTHSWLRSSVVVPRIATTHSLSAWLLTRAAAAGGGGVLGGGDGAGFAAESMDFRGTTETRPDRAGAWATPALFRLLYTGVVFMERNHHHNHRRD